MLEQWEKESPGRLETISRALGDVRPSQLSDRTLFDFMALGRRGDAPLPDPEAWAALSPAAADDEPTSAAAKPDALAALRAKAFDPIWNP